MLRSMVRSPFVGIEPALFPAPWTITRTQASGSRTSAPAWGIFGADTLRRFRGVVALEGPVTMPVRNPAGEGATINAVVPNAGSTTVNMPTHWQIIGTIGAGLTLTSLGPVTVDGLPGVRFRLAGTPGTTTGFTISTERNTTANGGPAAADGQTWTGSMVLRMVEGSSANLITSVRVSGRQSTGALATSASTAGLPSSGVARRVVTHTMASALTALTTSELVIAHTDTVTPVSAVFDIAAPQSTQTTGARQPIFPAAGSTVASEHGGDRLSAPLAALGIPATGAGAFSLRGLVVAPSGAAGQVLWQQDGGSEANVIRVHIPAGGSTVQLQAIAASVAGTPVTLGTITPDVSFRLTVVNDGLGGVTAVLDSNPSGQLFGVPGGLTTMRVGNDSAGAAPMFGLILT